MFPEHLISGRHSPLHVIHQYSQVHGGCPREHQGKTTSLSFLNEPAMGEDQKHQLVAGLQCLQKTHLVLVGCREAQRTAVECTEGTAAVQGHLSQV